MQTMQWGVEYARNGVRVVSVSPGAIDTPLVRATLAQQGGAAKLANRHPLGRIGRPEEVAAMVAFLCSPANSYTSGERIYMDASGGSSQ